jgi:hypothetical protein
MDDGAAKHVIHGRGETDNRSGPFVSRVLALEVRASKFGFAVFDEPAKVIDWGVRAFDVRASREATVAKRIGFILDQYAPFHIVVLRRRNDPKSKRNGDLSLALKVISREMQARGVKPTWLTTQAVKRFFCPHGFKTKHEIATVLAGWFEELSWRLPLRRKPWQSERHNMVIFDAVALGVVFFATQDASLKASEH